MVMDTRNKEQQRNHPKILINAKALILEHVQKQKDLQSLKTQQSYLQNGQKSIQNHKEKFILSETRDASSETLPVNSSLDNDSFTFSEDRVTGKLSEDCLKTNMSETSIQGHLLHCFSACSPEYNETIKNKEYMQNVSKPKRSFLKKGTGLLRFQLKSKASEVLKKNTLVPKKQKPFVAVPTLKLKPAISKESATLRPEKFLRFDLPDENQPKTLNENDKIETRESEPKIAIASENAEVFEVIESISSTVKPYEENLIREKSELGEYEVLETYALNTSFTSDSSIVQKAIRGEPLQLDVLRAKIASRLPLPEEAEECNQVQERSVNDVNSVVLSKAGLKNYIEENELRKQHLQEKILAMEPRLASLNTEIERSCSTPVPLNADYDPDKDLSSCSSILLGSDVQTSEPAQHYFTNKEISYEDEDSTNPQTGASVEVLLKSELAKLHQKRKELEVEIEIHRERNSKLEVVQKEREEIVKTLQKEQEAFQKLKEIEKKKLNEEIEQERRQMDRQKETFMRYQKLRRDNPTRTERDELSALRQQVEKLQEELKREKIRCSRDMRRLRDKLTSIENERDSLKLENKRLEEQCEDLLQAFKTKQIKASMKTAKTVKVKEDSPKNLVENNKPILKESSEDNTGPNEKSPKNRVRFDPVPQFKDYEEPETGETGEEFEKDDPQVLNAMVEKVLPSSEKEIISPRGTRKYVSADGLTKTLFVDGNIKVVHPDKRTVFKLKNGNIETHFPDGQKEFEFPNGEVHRQYPDGTIEVRFPDGIIHTTFPDRSEEIHSRDGTVFRRSLNGTESMELPDGRIEIRTSTCRRREYPDGSVVILYKDGIKECRYPDGRIRKRDKDRNIILDTKHKQLNGFSSTSELTKIYQSFK